MCLAIRSQEGLEKVLRPYCTLCGLNAQFLFDMNGPRVRQLHTSSGSSGMMAQVSGGPWPANWGGRAVVESMQCKRQHQQQQHQQRRQQQRRLAFPAQQVPRSCAVQATQCPLMFRWT